MIFILIFLLVGVKGFLLNLSYIYGVSIEERMNLLEK